MSIFLTQLASDNFQRANESPLIHPPWSTDTFGQGGLQIISHLAQGTATFTDCTEIYTGVSLPNDQYASATLGAGIVGNANLVLGVRMTDNGSVSLGGMPGYFTRIAGTGNWTLQDGSGGHVLASGAGLIVNSADVFVLAAIGTTLYLIQNGAQVTSVVNTLWSTGSAMLVCATGASASAVQVSNFACGKASTSPGGTGIGFSTPDCRIYGGFPNTGVVQSDGTIFYTGETSSNKAIPPTDSRAAGASVDSRVSPNIPTNSRVAPK